MSPPETQSTQIPGVPEGPPYPYLVIRIHHGVYNRERIRIEDGPPEIVIRPGQCRLSCPGLDPSGADIPEGVREVFLDAVLMAVRKTGYRMCVVWGPDACTFVEKNGEKNPSNEPPSGGISIPGFYPRYRGG